MSVDSRTALSEFWQNFDFETPPYIHPWDCATGKLLPEEFLSGVVDHDSFVHSNYYGKRKSKLIHSHLLPSPFAGDLENSDIFILMLNPGFNVGDYFGERQPSFRRALRATLDQKLENEEFPFIWLNPELSFHPGFTWWSKKLGGLIEEQASRWGSSYYEASRLLSHRLCAVELFPYHSQIFEQKNANKKLPSIHVAQEFACKLGRRAQAGEVCVTVTRKSKSWKLPNCDWVYEFPKHSARSAHVTPNSDAGKKILAFIEHHPSSSRGGLQRPT